MDLGREELSAFYKRYLMRCNEHRFDELGRFVARDVNGPREGLSRYIAGLRAVTEAFADYHWDSQRLLIDDQWLACPPVRHRHTHRDLPRDSGNRPGDPYTGVGDLPGSRRQDCRMLGVTLGSTVRDELTSGAA